jgi:hypothetical protein
MSRSAPIPIAQVLVPPRHVAGYDEEEAIRLVEEMSFVNTYDLIFEPTDLGSIPKRLQRFEELLDEHVFLSTNEEHDTMSLASFQSHPLERERDSIMMQDSLESILRGLRWFQNKIIEEIERSLEVRQHSI